MNRREFLIHATIGGVTVPLLVTEIGCSEDENGGPGGASETFVSSLFPGHTHTIVIPDGDLTAGGAHTYTSSSTGHTHTVELSGQQINDLTVGCVVTQVSSNNDNHTHTWRIVFADFVADVLTTSQPDSTSHQHTVTVDAGDLTSPPAPSTLITSDFGGHEHEVVLDLVDIQALQSCQPVTKTSSIVKAHAHTFQIQRA
jgi:hypothetical protein